MSDSLESTRVSRFTARDRVGLEYELYQTEDLVMVQTPDGWKERVVGCSIRDATTNETVECIGPGRFLLMDRQIELEADSLAGA